MTQFAVFLASNWPAAESAELHADEIAIKSNFGNFT
jgi:hypothetical protein